MKAKKITDEYQLTIHHCPPYLLSQNQQTIDAKDINQLLNQLSDKPRLFTLKDYQKTLSQPHFYLFVIRNNLNRIVAMATIDVAQKLLKKVGAIDDVVVEEKYRGLGLGQALIKDIIMWALEQNINCLELTSRPQRKIANQLYVKLGFKKRATNCYRLEIKN